MKLHIYGDSYAAGEAFNSQEWCWAEKVAEKLKIPFSNNAVAGSSSEFSMYKLAKDIDSAKISINDLIIFVKTSIGRLSLEHFITKEPGISCNFPGLTKQDINSNPRWTYFKENFDHINWYYANQNREVQNIHHEGFLNSLKSLAYSAPGIQILLIMVQDGMKDRFGFLQNLPKNLYLPNINLNDISKDEFAVTDNFYDWQKIAGYDPRTNHLSRPNLETLIDLTTTTFLDRHTSHWSKDKFKAKIFNDVKLLKHYLEYCNKELLWRKEDIVQKYKEL